MTSSDIDKIEEALAVRMPGQYRAAMLGAHAIKLSEYGLFDDASLIIERTKEQRLGYGGAAPWPQQFVYIGDQEDACPYALDCTSGAVVHSDHGSMLETLGRYDSVDQLADELLDETEAQTDQRSWWMFWKK